MIDLLLNMAIGAITASTIIVALIGMGTIVQMFFDVPVSNLEDRALWGVIAVLVLFAMWLLGALWRL